MALQDKAHREKQRAKIVERVQQGLTTKQVSERLGVTPRQVLRIKKWLRDQGLSDGS